MVELQGKRCRLRSVVSSDVDTTLLWENDPALAPFSDPHEPYTREQIEVFIANQQAGLVANGQLRLMIELDGRAIGALDIFDYDGSSAEVGILIYEQQMRRKGYAREALNTFRAAARSFNIERLTAVINEDNEASRALFCRCGFTKDSNNKYICNMKRVVAPSILSADFGNLERDTQMLNRSAAEWVHVDVMDGVFVPNISFGFPVLKAVTKVSTKVIDTHLMICDPIRYVEQFAKAGISIKPATEPEVLEQWLHKTDMVLVMSVEPGFGGQSFMPYSLDKVRRLKTMIERINPNCIIEIDGGISASNAAEVFGAGVDVVVAGSAVFCAESPEDEIVKILNA